MICGRTGNHPAGRAAPPSTARHGAADVGRDQAGQPAVPVRSGRRRSGHRRLRADDFEGQLKIVLDDALAVLDAAGSGPEHVLRVECWLADRGDFAAWNDGYAAAFPPPRPARTTLIAGLPRRRAPGRAAADGAGAAVSGPGSVLVVGGGVAGLCSAYYLRRAGVDVTVVESNRIGSGASWGNGGWVCPAQAGPLPEPGLTWYGIRSLFDRDSALYFKLSKFPELAPWLLRFWTYCNRRDHEHGVAALAALGRDVFDLVDEMRDDGVEFELHQDGMVVVAREPETARGELEKLQPMRAFGYELPDDILSAAELHELEPALADEVGGGFEVPSTGTCVPTRSPPGSPRRCAGWTSRSSRAPRSPTSRMDGTRVSGVRTAVGDYSADSFLLAAGAWTPPLAKMLGVRFPMQAGKGYSFSVSPSVMPSHSILLADVHVGCTPFGEPDADRRDDGVQRPQRPARPQAHRRHHRRRAQGVPAMADPRGRGRLGGHAADHPRRPPGPRPDARPQRLHRNRLRDAGRHARAPGRSGDGRTDHHRQKARRCSSRSASSGFKGSAEGGTEMAEPVRVVIIGSGNIGSDLLAKAGRSPALEVVGMAGIDPDSPGPRAGRRGRGRHLPRRA